MAKADSTTKIHLSEIASITMCTTHAYLSAYLLSELAKAKIPIVFCDEKSFPVAESLPLYGAYNCSSRVQSQLEWTAPSKKRLWRQIVRDKIALQSEVLISNGLCDDAAILAEIRDNVKSGDPTNREAVAAAQYFCALFGPGFSRADDNPLNASLNYGYSVILSKVCREIVSRGYLTQLGIFHRGAQNQWNLACDFVEPFRPFVDCVVLEVGMERFDTDTRRCLVDMLNRQVSYRDGKYKMSSVISLYVKGCLDVLEKTMEANDLERYRLL